MYSYYTMKNIWLEYKGKIIFKDAFIFPTWPLILLLDMKSTKALSNKKINCFTCSSITLLKKSYSSSLKIYSSQLYYHIFNRVERTKCQQMQFPLYFFNPPKCNFSFIGPNNYITSVTPQSVREGQHAGYKCQRVPGMPCR